MKSVTEFSGGEAKKMVEILLDDVVVGNDYPVYVIGEVGHNHMGSVEECKKLFRMAQLAGANAVKLQKRDNATLYIKSFFNSAYNSENAYGPTYGTHRQALEFTFGQYQELQEEAARLDLTFFATPFDLPSVDFLEKLNVPFYKIASAGIQNPLLLRAVGSIGKPVLVATGGAGVEQIRRAVDALQGCPIVLMHCVAAYPAKAEKMNIRRVVAIKNSFPECVTGFSDHEHGFVTSHMAVAFGASVFEKHITLDHTAKGTDHPFSQEFAGFSQYIKNLNRAKAALEIYQQPMEEENAPTKKMGYSVYPSRDIPAGTVIESYHLVIKSPLDGLPGWTYDELLGRKTTRFLLTEEPLDWSDFEAEY